MLIRASIGTLARLKMAKLKVEEVPTTAYLLQHSSTGCLASCSFCPQSKDSESRKDMLSRIKWPAVELENLVQRLKEFSEVFKRICIQSVLKQGFQEELIQIIKEIRETGVKLPISISIPPVDLGFLQTVKGMGVDFIGVGLDAASPSILSSVKKPYSWKRYWEFVRESINVMGRGRVNVHLIFGLGETEREFAIAMQTAYNIGAGVSLFSLTPVKGTSPPLTRRPDVTRYRVMQILRFLLSKGLKLGKIAIFEGERVVLKRGPWLKGLRSAFLTSGCPWCNRPFYNETPRLIYNYPSESLLESDIERVKEQISLAGLDPEVV